MGYTVQQREQEEKVEVKCVGRLGGSKRRVGNLERNSRPRSLAAFWSSPERKGKGS